MSAAAVFKQAEMDVFSILGAPVTYTPVTGTPITIQALISSSFQTQPSGMGSETWGQHITVEFMLSDIPDPSPGDTVTDASGVYTLVAPMENNGQIVKWITRKNSDDDS